MDKTTGRQSSVLLSSLLKKNKNIFSIEDALCITHTSYAATAKLLIDMRSRNLIERLKPGKYVIVPQEIEKSSQYTPNHYLIVKSLVKGGYYISHYSAMDLNNMVTQPVVSVYTTVKKWHRNVHVLGVEYRFIRTSDFKKFGLKEMFITAHDKAVVSNIERTIIDCLGLPRYCGGITEIAKGIWMVKDKIHFIKLKEYVKKEANFNVAKRLGFILETFQIKEDKFIAFLKSFINNRYALLDPVLLDEGKYLARWRLRLNINPEELIAVIRT